MEVFDHIRPLRTQLLKLRLEGKKIGLVPTMGALHEGHLELLRIAKKQNDIVVCSIFVNPTQFNDRKDLVKYPRNLTADLAALESVSCDLVFHPEEEEMYTTSPRISIDFKEMEKILEGQYRKGHFAGVGIVVAKLFNIVQPDRAYFGQKDLQQFLIISQMVHDLSMDVELVSVPIVRAASGLALSSRNARLTDDQKEQATLLYKSLINAARLLNEGKRVNEVKEIIASHFDRQTGMRLEYIEVIDGKQLKIVDSIAEIEHPAICIAAYVEEVRLIDNMFLNEIVTLQHAN